MIVSNNMRMASSHIKETTGGNIPMSEIKLPIGGAQNPDATYNVWELESDGFEREYTVGGFTGRMHVATGNSRAYVDSNVNKTPVTIPISTPIPYFATSPVPTYTPYITPISGEFGKKSLPDTETLDSRTKSTPLIFPNSAKQKNVFSIFLRKVEKINLQREQIVANDANMSDVTSGNSDLNIDKIFKRTPRNKGANRSYVPGVSRIK